ncbi:hypothetical protein EOM82_08830 [bacterium]|nr:hypothetical protein [bacterium]
MNDDTIKLLRECDMGCKTACDNISQMYGTVKNVEIKSVLENYYGKHAGFNEQSGRMLMERGKAQKYPSVITKLAGAVTNGVKLKISATPSTVSKLTIDGCAMGIKSVGQNLNKYTGASEESRNLGSNIITTERQFMDEMIKYL